MLRSFLRRLLAGLLLLGLGCAPAWASRQVTDMAGRQVEVPGQIRTLYAVGHCIPLVWAIAPEKLGNNRPMPEGARRFLPDGFFNGKRSPGSGAMELSDEELVQMAPDLIVMEAYPGAAERADRTQARLQIPVVLVDQDMLHYPQAFSFLGQLLEQPEQAARLSDFVHRYLDPIRETARQIPEARRLQVYYAEGPDGLSTNPAGSAHTQLLEFVGARNVARVSNVPGEGLSKVSLEQLYAWQPQRILVWTPAAERRVTWKAIVDNPLWQNVQAVRDGQVLQIPWLPFSWFDRPPGSNRIIGAVWLAQTLYPQYFRLDLVKIIQEYFQTFYHQSLTEADARALLALSQPRHDG